MQEEIPLILGKRKMLAIRPGAWRHYEELGVELLEEKYKEYYYLDLWALKYGIPSMRALEEIGVYKRIIADVSPPSPGAIMDALLAGAYKITIPTSKIIRQKFVEEVLDLVERDPWLRVDLRGGEVVFRGKLLKMSPARSLEEILEYSFEGVVLWPPWEKPKEIYKRILEKAEVYFAVKKGDRFFISKGGEGEFLTQRDL